MVFYNYFSYTMTHSKTCRTSHHIQDQSTKHTLTTTTKKEGGEGGTVTPKAFHPNHAYLPLVCISSLEWANVNTRGSGEVDSDDLVVVHTDRAEEVTLDIDVHDSFSTQGWTSTITHLKHQLLTHFKTIIGGQSRHHDFYPMTSV